MFRFCLKRHIAALAKMILAGHTKRLNWLGTAQGLASWPTKKSFGSILKTQDCGSSWHKLESMPRSISWCKVCSAFCWKNCIIE